MKYIKQFNIPYASIYGDIVENEHGKLMTTGASRTGCMFCMFGVHLEKTQTAFKEWLLHILNYTITALINSVVVRCLITLGLIIPHYLSKPNPMQEGGEQNGN